MFNDLAYHLIISILEAFMWDGEVVGIDQLVEGPGVIVANHMGAIGPVGVCSALPMRLYPWVEGETVDRVKAPENIRIDFVEKVLHIEPPMSQTIAEGICKISTPLLLGLGCIPVPDTHEEQQATFTTSVALLQDGKFLLVAPEDTEAEADAITGIFPFKRGFLRLGELFFQATGKRLPFYPVAIHESRIVMVGEPIVYNPARDGRQERRRIVELLEQTIKRMYLDACDAQAAESILIKRNIS